MTEADNNHFTVEEEGEAEFFQRFLKTLCARLKASLSSSSPTDTLLFNSVLLLVDRLVDSCPEVDSGR